MSKSFCFWGNHTTNFYNTNADFYLYLCAGEAHKKVRGEWYIENLFKVKTDFPTECFRNIDTISSSKNLPNSSSKHFRRMCRKNAKILCLMFNVFFRASNERNLKQNAINRNRKRWKSCNGKTNVFMIFVGDTVSQRTFEHTKKLLCTFMSGGAHGVMDTATRVQILDETDCISHSTNTLWERYESNYSLPSYG